MGFDYSPRREAHAETRDLIQQVQRDELDISGVHLAAPQSVKELCDDYDQGEMTQEQLHERLLHEAPGNPGQVSKTLTSIRDLLIYILVCFSLTTGGDEALAQEQAEVTQKAVQHRLAQEDDPLNVCIDQARAQDSEQIFELGDNQDVYLVPQVVLTELARVTTGGGGEPGGLFTAEGFLEEKYVDEEDLIAYQSELIDRIGFSAAERAVGLLTDENNILVTRPEESVIRHELAHRFIHSLPGNVRRDLSEAAASIVAELDETESDSTYIESLDRMYVESLSDEYLGDYSAAVKLKPIELWAYLIQDLSFNPDKDGLDEVEGEKIVAYIKENTRASQHLDTVKDLAKAIDGEMDTINSHE